MSNEGWQKLVAEMQKRNLWKSLVGFPAGAFIILQVVDFFVDRYGLEPKLLTATLIFLVGCLPIVLIWNWNHGEDGHQHVRKGMPSIYFSLGIIAIASSCLFYMYGKDPSTYSENRIEANVDNHGITELPEKSIAILPFDDLSRDGDQAYFGDGMAEEILVALGDLRGLIVAGRTSSFAMQGKGFTLSEIGKLLKVKYILQGSIRKEKNQLRVSAQLSESTNGYQLWSQQFDRPYDDLFSVQNEIALEIKERLELEFLDNRQTSLIEAPTFSQKAYELYLQGNYFSLRPPEGTDKAIDFYNQALMIDPDFAEAHYKLAWVYNWQAWGGVKTTKEAFAQAYPHALKAYQLNPKYCREIINYYLWHKYDFKKAKEIMTTSGTEEDNYYMVTGDFSKGIEIAKEALESDPFRILSHLYIVHGLALTGEKEKLRNYADELKHTFQNISLLQWGVATFSNLILDYDYVMSYADKALILADSRGYSKFVIPFANARNGKRAEVQDFIQDVKRGDFNGDPNMVLALIYDGLGDLELAMDYLEKAHEDGEYLVVYMKSPYLLPNIYNLPRYQALLEKMNYPSDREL